MTVKGTVAATTERWSIRVTGVVQGVGFRPFVHNLASRLGVSGFVGNDGDGVFIEAEAGRDTLDAFRRALTDEAPPLAIVETVSVDQVAPTGDTGFRIVESAGGGGRTLVSPDLRTCDDCLTELTDPTDRRYRYPFINCTNCGPRFTIIRGLPYDRPLTTMAPFVMCEACAAEYEDPSNRRFHAQPNACPDCGPTLRLETASGDVVAGDPIVETRRLIAAGAVVAVKGLGGFHLACDARSDAAVARLRARKARPDKPLAVMVHDLDTARTVADVSDEEARLLGSRQRPIVLLAARPSSGLSPLVAPHLDVVGVMLPYTPLHQMLVQPGEVWVMTSGNRSQEPIVIGNDEARNRLADLADAFLVHDREIETHCDDSVVRVVGGRELPIRRSRGYAPLPIRLPVEAPPTLAVGAELKATFCLAAGSEAFMSQHIGDMENLETLAAFTRAVTHLQDLFGIEPEVLAADLHPRYLSSRWALDHAEGRPVVRVQHHHAHVASLLAEHGETGRVIGISFDGTGYGTDGTVWGGEVLVADLTGFHRAGHLAPVSLPGGDAAVRRPYRMALAHLRQAGIPWDPDLAPVRACPAEERSILATQLERGLNTVPTTSAGRLFDAVSSLVGVRHRVGYEGQAAMELEALVDHEEQGSYPFEVSDRGRWVIDPAPVLAAIVDDVRAGMPPGVVAARFHRGLAAAITTVAVRVRHRTGLATVGLTGGVFQNATLTETAERMLTDEGFRVLTHRLVPPNDGGLALGQAVVAATTRR